MIDFVPNAGKKYHARGLKWTRHSKNDSAVIKSLGSMVARDPALNDVADLGWNQTARREHAGIRGQPERLVQFISHKQ